MKKVYFYKKYIQIFNFTSKHKKVITKNFHKIILRNASMVICQNELKEILLLKEYRAGLSINTWGLPGGNIDNLENPIATAKRELFEETGIKCDKLKLILKYVRDGNYYCGEEFVFFTKVKGPKKIKLEENCYFKWASKKELKYMLSKKLFKTPGIISSIYTYLDLN